MLFLALCFSFVCEGGEFCAFAKEREGESKAQSEAEKGGRNGALEERTLSLTHLIARTYAKQRRAWLTLLMSESSCSSPSSSPSFSSSSSSSASSSSQGQGGEGHSRPSHPNARNEKHSNKLEDKRAHSHENSHEKAHEHKRESESSGAHFKHAHSFNDKYDYLLKLLLIGESGMERERCIYESIFFANILSVLTSLSSQRWERAHFSSALSTTPLLPRTCLRSASTSKYASSPSNRNSLSLTLTYIITPLLSLSPSLSLSLSHMSLIQVQVASVGHHRTRTFPYPPPKLFSFSNSPILFLLLSLFSLPM